MKLAIVYFTYNKDVELLNQSLRGVRRLQEKYSDWTIDVYICDDARHPLDEVPDEWNRIQTDFDRRGNLNGIPCIEGMLKVHADIFDKGDYDWTVKTDSDTYINNLDWLANIDPEETAQVGTYQKEGFNAGACYAFSKAGVKAMLELLENDPIIRRRCSADYKEDQAMTNLARRTHLRVVHHLNGMDNIDPKALFNHFYFHNDSNEEIVERTVEELTGAGAVAFKKWRWHGLVMFYYGTEDLRAISSMTEYADYVETQEKGHIVEDMPKCKADATHETPYWRFTEMLNKEAVSRFQACFKKSK